MGESLKAPFPYNGGKSRVASEVWQRFGNVPNYCEPFAGSLAVLLARPTPPKTETINDLDGHITNVWRAIQADPEGVASHADWPVIELDLHARHSWLNRWGRESIERMRSDPEYFDSKAAGWWIWGKSCWIGNGWCTGHHEKQQRPDLHCGGVGINSTEARKRPQLGRGGRGVHSQGLESLQIPNLRHCGMGVHQSPDKNSVYEWIYAISARIRNIRICCGDWSRICGTTPTVENGLTALFLDPPYSKAVRDETCYATDTDPAPAVRQYCIDNGGNRLLRIALCGYDGEGHDTLLAYGWTQYRWKANGGYGNQGEGRGKENRKREVIYFSPHCLPPANMTLFGGDL
jgi:DNA adenine methylase